MHPSAPSGIFPGYKEESRDPEQGLPPSLFPNINPDDNVLRWAFIRKVYSILSLQFILTAIVAGFVSFFHPVSAFLLRTPGLTIFIIILPLILLCPLYCYRQKHPVNLILLALFTIVLSFAVGVTCSFTKEKVVWESILLTAIVVVSLTMYTFWAARRGLDFSFLGPFLFTTLVIVILFLLIQILFPMGRLSIMIYGGIASVLFSAYIVYDTDNLIKRYSYDEYIWASVALYVDVINLFLALLTLFRGLET